MSQDDGHRHDQVALHHMQVAMTYAARIHADLDFTALGGQHFHLFETEWSPCFIEHCCLRLHSALLLYWLWYQEDLPQDCRCFRIYEYSVAYLLAADNGSRL